jgi:hypothetical protein
MVEELVAFHLAAAVVALYSLLRTRDRRLLPLLLLFVCLAVGHHRGEWDRIGRVFLYLAGVCGLALLLALSPRSRPPASGPGRDEPGGGGA